MGLYEADCWDRMMKDPLCGVEVPVCWEEHLDRAQILELFPDTLFDIGGTIPSRKGGAENAEIALSCIPPPSAR